jgi:hypothetical protein
MRERLGLGVAASPTSRRTAFSTSPAAVAKAFAPEAVKARVDAITLIPSEPLNTPLTIYMSIVIYRAN